MFWPVGESDSSLLRAHVSHHFVLIYHLVIILPTLCDPMQRSPWNSPGQNTGVGSLSLLQRIFQTQVSRTAGRFFTSWATREAQEYWSGYPIPSPGDLPDPGIEPGSAALQVDSLPTELSGKLSKEERWSQRMFFPREHHSRCLQQP